MYAHVCDNIHLAKTSKFHQNLSTLWAFMLHCVYDLS